MQPATLAGEDVSDVGNPMQPAGEPLKLEEDQTFWDAGSAVAKLLQGELLGPLANDVLHVGLPPAGLYTPPTGAYADKFWVVVRTKAGEFLPGAVQSGHSVGHMPPEAVYRYFRTEAAAKLFLAGYRHSLEVVDL